MIARLMQGARAAEMIATIPQGIAPLVLHVVPEDAIGGVEIAARSIPDGMHDGLAFAKYYISASQQQEPRSLNSPVTYVQASRALRALQPRLVIASLWRSCLVLLVLKLMCPSIRAVTFLHSATDVHWVDKVLNRLAMLVSDEIWADSQSTLDARVPASMRARAHVISFLLRRLPAASLPLPRPSFAFWGRLHWQKDLPRALRVFAAIRSQHPGATFHIIGPDGGDRKRIAAEVGRLGLGECVLLLGPMAQDAIFEHVTANCSFYLQTSVDEGMALSVVEAMMLGLVPVVTPVGEIARYCRDGENAIIVGEVEARAAAGVSRTLSEPGEYERLAAAAQRTWQGKPLYREEVLSACRRVLALA